MIFVYIKKLGCYKLYACYLYQYAYLDKTGILKKWFRVKNKKILKRAVPFETETVKSRN